jgi:6-phosphogluconolactonase
MPIRIFSDREVLSRAAAEFFVRIANAAMEERGRFSVALSGGSTPRRTYGLLAQPPFRGGMDWERVHVFWGDERCVPPEDPRSNARMANEELLKYVPVPLGQVHPILCAESPGTAAREYEKTLLSFFGEGLPSFDLIFLGLGEDGHTASLFPDTQVLQEKNRLVSEVYVEQQDLYRVTLTLPIINLASNVVFLVAGASKAQTLKRVMGGSVASNSLPAQMVQPASGELHWLLDEEAASQLK